MGRRNDRRPAPPRGENPPAEEMPVYDLYPNPLPPPRPPDTRETILADLQAGFAALTESELLVARLWIYGRSLEDVCYFLDLEERTAKKLYRNMRRKMREILMRGAPQPGRVPQPVDPVPQPQTGTQQEPKCAGPVPAPDPARTERPTAEPKSDSSQETGGTGSA
jgi:hypothetical protein